jgi:CheY-like chemotaxis protein
VKNRSNNGVNAESRFLANMSHEIRTPMNAILGFIELVLSDDELPQKQKKNLETAHTSAQYLLRLITDILDISKLESGMLKPDEKVFDLRTMITAVCDHHKSDLIKSNLELNISVADDCYGSVLGDLLHLTQTLDCLISNAIKFTDEGFIHIFVAKGNREGFVLFAVEDSGVGISEGVIDNIFEPFTQGDNSATRKYGGAGLGATIARGLVLLMGGTIGVTSKVGEGSRFFFEIPLVKINSEKDLEIAKKDEPVGSREFKILLVDDVETNLELARIHLHRKGHSIILARNGIEAIDLYLHEAPDVILMDIHMPIMDGHKATRYIRDMEKDSNTHVPIIALTASVLQDDYENFRRDGFDDVVDKPVNFEELFKTMERVIPEGLGVSREEAVEELGKAVDVLEPLIKDVDLLTLFGKIEKKMELYNPSDVNYLLEILSDHLPKGVTTKVVSAVDMFEFEDAQSELLLLKNEYVEK